MKKLLDLLRRNALFPIISEVAFFSVVLGITGVIFGGVSWISATVVYAFFHIYLLFTGDDGIPWFGNYDTTPKGKARIQDLEGVLADAVKLYYKDYGWMKLFRRIQGVGDEDSRRTFLLILFGWSIVSVLAAELFDFSWIIIFQAIFMFLGMFVGIIYHAIQTVQLNKMRDYIYNLTGLTYNREGVASLIRRYGHGE